eukprot:12638917-Alexandrium_andersonii.AAC.1
MQGVRLRGHRRSSGGEHPLPQAPWAGAPQNRQRAGPRGPAARGSRCACERERLGNSPSRPRESGGPRPPSQWVGG